MSVENSHTEGLIVAHTKRPILFLDVDGVLTNARSIGSQKTLAALDPECLTLLGFIVNMTHCRLILSSYWRFAPPLRGWLDLRLSERDLVIEGVTQMVHRAGVSRDSEIEAWLRHNHVLDDYPPIAILDDNSQAGRIRAGDLFLTEADVGLTEEIAEAVISHLSSQPT